MLSVGTSRRVYVDANAVIDYIRERTLHDHGMRPTGRRAEVLRVRLGQEGRVCVAATAGIEAEKNLVKDLTQKLKRVDADIVKDPATNLLHEYLDNMGVEDYLEHVSTAQKMYAAISGDPQNQKFFRWKRKKRQVCGQSDARVGRRRSRNTVDCRTACTEPRSRAMDTRHGLYHVRRRNYEVVQRESRRHLPSSRLFW